MTEPKEWEEIIDPLSGVKMAVLYPTIKVTVGMQAIPIIQRVRNQRCQGESLSQTLAAGLEGYIAACVEHLLQAFLDTEREDREREKGTTTT